MICWSHVVMGHYFQSKATLFYANVRLTSMQILALRGMRVSGPFQLQRNSLLIQCFPRLRLAQSFRWLHVTYHWHMSHCSSTHIGQPQIIVTDVGCLIYVWESRTTCVRLRRTICVHAMLQRNWSRGGLINVLQVQKNINMVCALHRQHLSSEHC